MSTGQHSTTTNHNATNSGNITQFGSTALIGNILHGSTINIGSENQQRALKKEIVLRYGPINPWAEKTRIELSEDVKLPKAADWILNAKDFQAWLHERHEPSKCLLISGGPGRGKTMIANTLVSRIRAMLPRSAVAVFFCERRSHRLSSAIGVLNGLIYSLIADPSGCGDKLINSLDSLITTLQVDDAESEPFALLGVLSHLIQHLTFGLARDVFILVDGLDALPSNDIGVVLQLMDLLAEAGQGSTWARPRLIMTCRKSSRIEDERRKRPLSWLHIGLDAPHNKVHVATNVNVYIKSKVSRLALSKNYSQRLKSKVEDYIVSNANSTFLWAAMVLRYLSQLSIARAERSLFKFPPGLDPLYASMLSEVENQEDEETAKQCMVVLRVVATAWRPLESELVANLSGVEEGEDSQAILKDLLSRCASFLEIRSSEIGPDKSHKTIAFFHPSCHEYFHNGGNGHRIFHDGRATTHKFIADRCLYLMSRQLKSNMLGLNPGEAPRAHRSQTDISETLAKANPLLSYPCRFWLDHLIAAADVWAQTSMLAASGDVLTFLETRLLQWLEFLCWRQELPQAQGSLLRFCSCHLASLIPLANVSVSGSTSRKSVYSLQDMLLQSARFVERAAPIIAVAPLQVYSGALLSCLQDCRILSLYRSVIPEWVSRFDHDTRDSQLMSKESCSSAVAFSQSMKYLAVASSLGHPTLWDLESGKAYHLGADRTLLSHAQLVFSPQDRFLAVKTVPDMIYVWELPRSKGMTAPKIVLRSRWRSSWHSFAFSYLEKYFAYQSPNSSAICIMDMRTEEVNEVALDVPADSRKADLSLCFTKDDSALAIALPDSTIAIWDLKGKRWVSKTTRCAGRPTSLSFSNSGEKLVVCLQPEAYTVWPIERGRIVAEGRNLQIPSLPKGALPLEATQAEFNAKEDHLAMRLKSGDDVNLVRLLSLKSKMSWLSSPTQMDRTCEPLWGIDTHGFMRESAESLKDGKLPENAFDKTLPSRSPLWVNRHRDWIICNGTLVLRLPYFGKVLCVKAETVVTASEYGDMHIYRFNLDKLNRALSNTSRKDWYRNTRPAIKPQPVSATEVEYRMSAMMTALLHGDTGSTIWPWSPKTVSQLLGPEGRQKLTEICKGSAFDAEAATICKTLIRASPTPSSDAKSFHSGSSTTRDAVSLPGVLSGQRSAVSGAGLSKVSKISAQVGTSLLQNDLRKMRNDPTGRYKPC